MRGHARCGRAARRDSWRRARTFHVVDQARRFAAQAKQRAPLHRPGSGRGRTVPGAARANSWYHRKDPHVVLIRVLVPFRRLVVLDASDVPARVEDVGDPSYLQRTEVSKLRSTSAKANIMVALADYECLTENKPGSENDSPVPIELARLQVLGSRRRMRQTWQCGKTHKRMRLDVASLCTEAVTSAR